MWLSQKQASSLSKTEVLHSFAFIFPVNIFQCVPQTEMWLLRLMECVPEWPQAKRTEQKKNDTNNKGTELELATETVNLGDMVLIKERRGGWGKCCQERLWHILQRERRTEKNDFMLKEGDGCDPVVSHVPCGVQGGAAAFHAYFSSLSSPLSVRPVALLSSALLQHLQSV